MPENEKRTKFTEPREASSETEKIEVPKGKKEKPKLTNKTESKELTFPCEGFVNKYNFLRVSDAILEKLGWSTGVNVDITIDVKDGALVVKKA